MTEIENVIDQSYCPNLIFKYKKNYFEDKVNVWPPKSALKAIHSQFLKTLNKKSNKISKNSFGAFDLNVKICGALPETL